MNIKENISKLVFVLQDIKITSETIFFFTSEPWNRTFQALHQDPSRPLDLFRSSFSLDLNPTKSYVNSNLAWHLRDLKLTRVYSAPRLQFELHTKDLYSSVYHFPTFAADIFFIENLYVNITLIP